MRHDMVKVVTEPARAGSNWRSEKTGWRLTKDQIDLDDHGPSRIGSSRTRQSHMHEKSKGILFGPLRRFLKSNIGKPWDVVHSQLARAFDRRSPVGIDIWDRIEHEVETDCVVGEGNTVFVRPRFGFVYEPSGLYVHPKTGLLCYQPDPPRDRDVLGQKFLKRLDTFGIDGRYGEWKKFRIVNDLTILEKKPAGWFVHFYKMYDPEELVASYTTGKEKFVPRKTLRYLPTKYLVRSRQLGKKDLKKCREIISRDPRDRGFFFDFKA